MELEHRHRTTCSSRYFGNYYVLSPPSNCYRDKVRFSHDLDGTNLLKFLAGEALNIDLSDFISRLFSMLLPLSFVFETEGQSSVIDILFRALNVIFSPKTSGASSPLRSAAFTKRLLSVSLHWPPFAALRTLDFVSSLIAKDPKLEAMLSTEDRIFNGIYRADVDDPELCHPFESSFWELHALYQNHWDPKVRQEAKKLLDFKSL